jgi:ribosomal protein S18 acetylase RimI-like enzyme
MAISIIPIDNDAMVSNAANLHAEVFGAYLNSRFGKRYITSYINWFVHTKEALAIAAVDDERHIVGYALGVSSKHGHKMHQALRWVVASSLMLRPWILCDKRFWQEARSRMEPLARSEKAGERDHLPQPSMALVTIGVHTSYRRESVGLRLMEVFEQIATNRKKQSLYAWVFENNMSARRLYEKCGWQPCTASLSTRGSLRYFKLID